MAQAATIPLTASMALPHQHAVLVGWRLRLTWWLMKYSAILSIIVSISFAIVSSVTSAGEWIHTKGWELYDRGLMYLPQPEIIHPEKISVERALDLVSREMKFEPTILRAMALQESGDYTATNRVKEEPQLLESRKINPPANLNKIERLLWASSHGVMQIIFGFHYKECGLPTNGWDKLYDPLTNIRCGARILKNNLDRYRASIRDQSERLWLALRDYNNSGDYANEVMARINKMRKLNYGEGV